MKIDLTNVTFMIPVRVDSLVRLENLILTVRFLSQHFSCHIIVLEADAYNNGIIRKMLGKRVEYPLYQLDDGKGKDPLSMYLGCGCVGSSSANRGSGRKDENGRF